MEPTRDIKGSDVARQTSKGTYLLVVPWDLDHPGGVNQVVLNLYREFEHSGPLKPLVLVIDWASVSLVEAENAGCKTIRLRIRQPAGNKVYLRALVTYFFTLPVTLWRLRRLVVKYDVRVINAHYPTLAFINFIVLKKLRLFKGPLLVSFHGMDVRNANEADGLVKFFWRWLAKGTDSLIGCSDALVREARMLAPNLRTHFVKVFNGVKSETALREELLTATGPRQMPPGRFILNVATFEHKKGQDILVRAFARLAKQFPDVDLVIIGGNGPAWEPVNALIEEAGLGNRVLCLRNMPHAEVLAYLEKATVFAFPSRYEPLGIAMLEAGIFKVPIVAARVDGIPEVINSADFGILIDPEDDVALENALVELLNDSELRARLGQKLQQRVLKDFTWRSAWEKYVALMGAASLF